jgi:hypothetical protein
MVQARIPEALRVTSSLPEKSSTGVCNFITGPGDMHEQSIRNKVSGGLIVGFDVTHYLMPHRLPGCVPDGARFAAIDLHGSNFR